MQDGEKLKKGKNDEEKKEEEKKKKKKKKKDRQRKKAHFACLCPRTGTSSIASALIAWLERSDSCFK